MSAPPVRWNLTRRLVLILTGALGSLWFLAVIASTLVTLHEVNEVFDSALQETAQRLVGLAAHHYRDDDGEYESDAEEPQEFGDHEEYLIYQVRDPRGRILLRSHDAPEKPFDAPLEPGMTNVDGMRILTESTRDRRLFVQVAERDEHRYEAARGTLLLLLLPLLALLPLSALAIWLTVRRGIAPLAAVEREIRDRGGARLDPVPSEGLPDELAPIATSVNRLRERLSRALDAERAFAANSAHELRTPVAAARAQAQLLADELREGPSAERARALAATLGRLSRLVEKLLQLSRASSGVALNRQETDLAAIVRVVVNEYRSRKVDTARIVLDPDPPPATSVFTDPDALGIVVQNLIDNALTHGDRTQPVVVSVGAGSSVSVINAGPAVAPDVLASLKQRFVRGPTRAEGSGLGLSIVEAIVAQAGARLDLHSPARGRDDGFEAVVTFPPAP
jgi:two-component system OmpR family sensor kinase